MRNTNNSLSEHIKYTLIDHLQDIYMEVLDLEYTANDKNHLFSELDALDLKIKRAIDALDVLLSSSTLSSHDIHDLRYIRECLDK